MLLSLWHDYVRDDFLTLRFYFSDRVDHDSQHIVVPGTGMATDALSVIPDRTHRQKPLSRITVSRYAPL